MSIELNSSAGAAAYDEQREKSVRTDGLDVQRTTEQVRQAIAEQQNTQEERTITEEETRQVAETIAATAYSLNRDLNFSVNNDIGQTVIRVVDRDSGEVIRQIPNEEVIRLATRLRELSPEEAIDSATGLLLDSTV